MLSPTLNVLCREFAQREYDGSIEENKSTWPLELRNAANNMSNAATCIGINDSLNGFQVICLEPYSQNDKYLIYESSFNGAELNLWIRYAENDWDNLGAKDDSHCDS